MADARQKLIGLLDYVEQVVRLDERIAFQLSEYRLPDGTVFALYPSDTHGLPGVRHDLREDGEFVWLEVERLARKEPPQPPAELAEWLGVSPDPANPPQVRAERLVTVSAAEKDTALAKGEVKPEDIMDAPRRQNEAPNEPKKFDLKLRLSDRPETQDAIDKWIAGPWQSWAVQELPRRKTIAIYQKLYKVFQLLEIGAGESQIEVSWGIGVAHWHKDGRILHRPLLERRVEVELDDKKGGLLRVRPTAGSASFDLRPYEEIGCDSIHVVFDLVQREIRRVEEDDGVSPFVSETYEHVLSAAANRLDPDGGYATAASDDQIKDSAKSSRLLITGQWVLFARPRSQHVILQDIDRLRKAAADQEREIGGLARRLVTEPSRVVAGERWEPLSGRIGGAPIEADSPSEPEESLMDVFFPKPFNADQVEIIKRLQKTDGLVVQGPPGTGKTHTIANIICHAMATGERVLVVSRGEAALSVLREQLPPEVQPLAIAVMSSERAGLKQIETAIRRVQEVVDGSKPENRRSTIRRLEKEIDGLQIRMAKLDAELDEIASAHLADIGPRNEKPADLAKRIVEQRDAFSWLTDRPTLFSSQLSIGDREWAELDDARRRIGELIDHSLVSLPSPADLPTSLEVAAWHADLVRSLLLQDEAAAGPAPTVRVGPGDIQSALSLAQTLDQIAAAHVLCHQNKWLQPLFVSLLRNGDDPWCAALRERVAEWDVIERERANLMRRAVDISPDILKDEPAFEAVKRAANGERLWSMIAFGKSASKALTAAIRLDGAPPSEDDTEGWRHVLAVLSNLRLRQETVVRWQAFVAALNAPVEHDPRSQMEAARALLKAADDFAEKSAVLSRLFPAGVGTQSIAEDSAHCLNVSKQIKSATAAIQLASAKAQIDRITRLFTGKNDRTSALVQQMFERVVGDRNVPAEKVDSFWTGILQRLEILKNLRPAFDSITKITEAIRVSGAPEWARRLRTEAPNDNDRPLISFWRDAWDFAAAEAALERIDTRKRLTAIAEERESADKQCRKLFGELVRERTFYALDRRLSPSVKGALVEFVRALARIGRGTGKGAGKHRATAREAMARCYDAVPCWIMPTWRVAEQLPPEMGAIDLVIVDEASQSDVTEIPALLRGKKLLVVGDDRQVSPTAPFVTQSKIDQLRHHYLGELPFRSLLEPGESIYDLMRAVFPDNRLMLKEHFRCVEPIIQFSMQFYPEQMLPLRVPKADERLDPPLVDVYIPHGTREFRRKVNRAEADFVIEEVKKITEASGKPRTIGIISLIGAEQAEFIRSKLSETIGEELMQRHAILCGDSATFQGTERDIVFLSMVADPQHKTALTMLRYEQRFNVAVSRARDRVFLVRSVKREDLKPNDLKARLIAHFDEPMPMAARGNASELDRCESEFERDVFKKLLQRGYRVRSQVGAIGYRIDIVVEGADGRRLAVECDGDRFHGPEQWRDDMRRQRVLERVGWRFWRCFASSYYRDPPGVANDLFDTLRRFGIEPMKDDAVGDAHRFTARRVIEPPESIRPVGTIEDVLEKEDRADSVTGIGVGDRLNLIFADDKRRMALRLTEETEDHDRGFVSINSPLGKALAGSEEGDEIDVDLGDGRIRKVLIEVVISDSASRPPSESISTELQP